MKHLDLFSGIGGFALAADRVWPGIEHVFCDNDPFCQAVLKKHWPTSKIYGDIRALTNTRSEESRRVSNSQGEEMATSWQCDLLTGGFPCQPFSHAGKRKGTNDDRHLWPEMRRVIQEFSPRWVVGENVRGLLSIDGGMVFESVCVDLEDLGYEVQPFVIPACAVNAPHRRDRVWIVANSKHKPTRHEECRGNDPRASSGITGSDQNATNPAGIHVGRRGRQTERYDRECGGEGTDERRNQWDEDWSTVATRLCAMDDGLPARLVRFFTGRNKEYAYLRARALKAAGNAIVPQVVEQIFQTIKNVSCHRQKVGVKLPD